MSINILSMPITAFDWMLFFLVRSLIIVAIGANALVVAAGVLVISGLIACDVKMPEFIIPNFDNVKSISVVRVIYA